jgi:hypothetical protein
MEKVMMMMQGNVWASLSSRTSDRVKHGECISCMICEGSWLRNNKKVCEKVELYDFRWSALRESTRFIYINTHTHMTVYIVLFNWTIK